MFCRNCGKELQGNEIFCGKCGTRIIKESDLIDSELTSQNTNTKQLGKESRFSLFIAKIKMNGLPWVTKHKKSVGIVLGIIIICFISYILFQTFYDFTFISWDENSDTDIMYSEGGTLDLKVLAYDKEKQKITNIAFEVDGGEIEVNQTEVKWTLPETIGKYTIKATAPSGKSISKEVTVIEIEKEALAGVVEETPEDIDNDGLTDTIEESYGTNKYSADTDLDGLLDIYEIETSKTDPLNSDSDQDGLNDGDELTLGFDPLNADSLNDGIKDGERKISYQLEENNVTLTIEGTGNIASTVVDTFSDTRFQNKSGILDTMYNFYTKGNLKQATVTIKYDTEEVLTKNLQEEDLKLYHFNEETKKLEEIPTTINLENHELTATLTHFSKYIIGDNTLVDTDNVTELLFVIDNSVSLYSDEQMIEAGEKNAVGAVGNDTQFKRLTLTNQLIDMLGSGYHYSIAEFSGSYRELQGFTEDTSKAKEAVSSMKSTWHTWASGTNIVSALQNAINKFSKDSQNHYILLFTDGEDTTGKLDSIQEELIESAQEKDVKICMIGLGEAPNTSILSNIASATGCGYYNASSANTLDEIYSIIGTEINYNLVDTDEDGTTDSMVMADSGFIVTRDGFPFPNYSSELSDEGHCYGMATFANLYYRKTLPVSLPYVHKHTIFKRFEPAEAYDLTETYFETYQSLYNFEVTTPGLHYALYGPPADYRNRVEDDTLMIKKEYYDDLEKIGASFQITEKDSDGYSKIQGAQFQENSELFKENATNDEYQIIKAIYRLFVLQVDDDRISFSSEPDKAFESLKTNLADGNPIVTIIYNGHAVNIIRLIQSSTDANQFYLEIYDNNYPGETKYIKMTRSKMNKIQLSYTAWTNDYSYAFEYDKKNDGNFESISVVLSFPNPE